MSKKIGLHIGGRRFDIDVEDEFASYLESEMKHDFNFEGNNDAKSMLHAYVRKSYELFRQKKKIEKILEKLEERE